MGWQLLLTIAVSIGILNAIGLLYILNKKWKKDSAKCGRHDVVVNVYETLKPPEIKGVSTWIKERFGIETKPSELEEGITFHIQMTEFTADMIKLNEWYYAKWNDFLNDIWFERHENIRKGLIQPETYWFGERSETVFDEDLEQLMKENEIRPKDLK